MTKRVIRDTGGFLPEYERENNQRYIIRGADPKWTLAQDAVLVAAVCACRGRPAYLSMAPHLMAALGHPPTYPEGCLPHPAKHANTCMRALELRLVSKMLAAHNGWKPGPLAGFHKPTHEDYPMTWGMKAKILRPYALKTAKTQLGDGILALSDLIRMIGCSHSLVEKYLGRVLNDPPFKDRSIDTAESPVKESMVDKLRDQVLQLDYCLKVNLPSWKYKDAITRLLRVS